MTAIQMIALGKKISNVYSALSMPICRKYGINQTCFDIMMFCANNPEFNTARDICEIRGIKSGIVSVAVESLIKNGFLESRCDAADRRINRLIPTASSRDLIENGRRMQLYFTESLGKGITEDELAILQKITNKMESNITLLEKEEVTQC